MKLILSDQQREQEERWAQQREACLFRYLQRVQLWLTIDNAGEKRRVYRQCVEEIGEIAAKACAATVLRIKDAAARKHMDPESDLPRMTPEEQLLYLRRLLR